MEPSQSGIYQSVPLKDENNNWIRLLHVCTWNEDDEPLAFRLGAHPIYKVPKFNAISYAWGDPNQTGEIVVNGTRVRVRENARYALWQARLFGAKRIWIDSICINQEDLEEKGAQVAMMFDIYSAAGRVLACVGHADEASDFLIDAVPEIWDVSETIANPKSDRPSPADSFHIWNQWALSKGADFCRKFRDAYNELFRRPYFKRLWIVQELFAGWSCVILLVGDSMVPHQVVKYLQLVVHGVCAAGDHMSLMAGEKLSPRPGDTILTILAEFGIHGRDDPLSYLWKTQSFLCQDPRDRIYGTTGLWRQSGHRRPLLIIDYNKTAFDIAVEVAANPSVEVWHLEHLASALQIQLHDPQLVPSVVRKRGSTHSRASPRRREWAMRLEWESTLDTVEANFPSKYHKDQEKAFSQSSASSIKKS